MINEKPILMSTPMVQAILDGRKTQTRRLRGLDEINENPDDWTILLAGTPNTYELARGGDNEDCAMFRSGDQIRFIKIPYPERGDLLWVKENFRTAKVNDTIKPSSLKEDTCIEYNAGGSNVGDLDTLHLTVGRTRPCIHMPKIYSRIWLMVESVSLERVLDISEEDAVAEGVEPQKRIPILVGQSELTGMYKNYVSHKSNPTVCSHARCSFRSLWWSINGSESWRANPWVWVIKYRILSTSRRPSDEVIAANQKGLLAPKLI
jgi:hypothetical protein